MSILTATQDNFDAEILQCEKPVLIDFWASWCNPCRILSPIIDEIADENPGIKVAKVNIDEQPELAAKYGVMSIPTLLKMEQGKVADTMVGVKPKSEIVGMFQ